jgi:hypothetical protein
MTLRLPAINHFALLLAAGAALAIGLSTAEAQTQKPYYGGNSPTYGAGGPNVSYQQGPRTRVFITKRSWLDAGVEVLPGDRHFTDYAYPPGPSFGIEDKNRPLERQPLYPASDLGGYPQSFPLY